MRGGIWLAKTVVMFAIDKMGFDGNTLVKGESMDRMRETVTSGIRLPSARAERKGRRSSRLLEIVLMSLIQVVRAN